MRKTEPSHTFTRSYMYFQPRKPHYLPVTPNVAYLFSVLLMPLQLPCPDTRWTQPSSSAPHALRMRAIPQSLFFFSPYIQS